MPVIDAAFLDEARRCERCGWRYAASDREGCLPGNCSQRPLLPVRPGRTEDGGFVVLDVIPVLVSEGTTLSQPLLNFTEIDAFADALDTQGTVAVSVLKRFVFAARRAMELELENARLRQERTLMLLEMKEAYDALVVSADGSRGTALYCYHCDERWPANGPARHEQGCAGEALLSRVEQGAKTSEPGIAALLLKPRVF